MFGQKISFECAILLLVNLVLFLPRSETSTTTSTSPKPILRSTLKTSRIIFPSKSNVTKKERIIRDKMSLSPSNIWLAEFSMNKPADERKKVNELGDVHEKKFNEFGDVSEKRTGDFGDVHEKKFKELGDVHKKKMNEFGDIHKKNICDNGDDIHEKKRYKLGDIY